MTQDLIILGAPGAGKGTLAVDLCPALGIKHISTGDLLREVIASGSPLGQEIDGYVKSGALVPDDLIGRMIKDTLAADACRQGILLDGFPRTIPQAELLEKILADLGRPISAVFYLSVELDRVIRRLVNRVSCQQCGRPYHLINLPPRQAGICDVCGGVLRQREDDKEETIRKRFATFLEKTQPLIDFYQNKNLLVEVQASDDPQVALNFVLKYLAR
ncbi:adenylate kinase [Candidatus Termititenax persephonae]|uniref:Adenylate kinase n=1 Tax=Candidatus Termititenax persephonae TaxID=2218525 RepID=A0A388THN5_9BACT|nr:adenylate kinase [Candidatus Termititenax persephonae]